MAMYVIAVLISLINYASKSIVFETIREIMTTWEIKTATEVLVSFIEWMEIAFIIKTLG